MKRRIVSLITGEPLFLLVISLTSLFWLQALRYLIGTLYSRLSSVAVSSLYPPASIPPNTLGVVLPDALSGELAWLGILFGLPLLMLVIGRWWRVGAILVIAISLSRWFMSQPNSPMSDLIASQWVVGLGLMFIVWLIRHRARSLPLFFILGLGLDQLFRAYGNTLDPSWQADYTNSQLVLSVLLAICAVFNLWRGRSSVQRDDETNLDSNQGILSFSGGIGLGALLFLQLTLFALPNAIAARTDGDYALFTPWVIVATLAPLLPLVRLQARQAIAPFDSNTRGWVWLIILVLLIVVGTRIQRISLSGFELQIGSFGLTLVQVGISLLWWWFIRPQAPRERNLSALWVMVGALFMSVLLMFDLLTYDYAFVTDFAPPLDFLNGVIPPILRGFRGLGLGVILLAVTFAVLPMIRSTRRVPWQGGTRTQTLLAILGIGLAGGLGAYFARPVAVAPILNVNELRVGTYNIHAGYSEFYRYDLEGVARAIQASGAEVVLLQEVEAGRLTSFGVDQSLWLARRLGMDRRFYPTTEGLQGLAVLSRVPIVFDDGEALPSLDRQTGLQRVQIRPDQGVVIIYNTNLGVLLAGDTLEQQEANQRQQLNAILGIIETHIQRDYNGQLGRMILGGTFNNIPDSPLIQDLQRTGFTDPFAGTTLTDSATLIRTDVRARVDYLWIWGETLRSLGRGVIIENDASDHRMTFIGVEIGQN